MGFRKNVIRIVSQVVTFKSTSTWFQEQRRTSKYRLSEVFIKEENNRISIGFKYNCVSYLLDQQFFHR